MSHRDRQYYDNDDDIKISELIIMTNHLACLLGEVKILSAKLNKSTLGEVVYKPPSANVSAFKDHMVNIIETLKGTNETFYIRRFKYNFTEL